MAPRLSGGVAHAMAASCHSPLSIDVCLSPKRRRAAWDMRVDVVVGFQDDRAHNARKILVRNCASFWLHCRLRSSGRVGPLVEHVSGPREVTLCDRKRDGAHDAGHHAVDARAVLGSVQGSSLRFDRACARPSGLDAACAQLVDWQLRDGRSCEAARINRLGIDQISMTALFSSWSATETLLARRSNRGRASLTSDTSDRSGSDAKSTQGHSR